jgi:hypothetical protein
MEGKMCVGSLAKLGQLIRQEELVELAGRVELGATERHRTRKMPENTLAEKNILAENF